MNEVGMALDEEGGCEPPQLHDGNHGEIGVPDHKQHPGLSLFCHLPLQHRHCMLHRPHGCSLLLLFPVAALPLTSCLHSCRWSDC